MGVAAFGFRSILHVRLANDVVKHGQEAQHSFPLLGLELPPAKYALEAAAYCLTDSQTTPLRVLSRESVEELGRDVTDATS